MISITFGKVQLLLLTFIAALFAPSRRVMRPRRGAEFIEVALYAGVILAIVAAFRFFLPDAFDSLLGDIRDALNVRY